MQLTPQSSGCSTATERIEAEGEEAWRSTAPDSRRTYGTSDPDDDALPPYTETNETGAVFIHHGSDEVDIEATAELAAQDDPDEDDDLVVEEQPAPAAGAPVPERARGTERDPRAPGRGNEPPQWGRLPGVESAPGPEGAPTVFTDSDGGAGIESRRPQSGVGHGPLLPDAGPSPLRRMRRPAGETGPGTGGAVPRPAGGEGAAVPGSLAPGSGESEAEPDPTAAGEKVPWAVLLTDGETVARYHAHVLRRGPDECWWWTGGLTDTAHGTFRAVSLPGRTRRGTVPAHLFGYRLANGPDSLPPGLVVRHTCDEPPCQNPAHWLAGTRGDNNRDAASRRRLAGHALADVRGAVGRARAVQAAIAAARPEDLDAAIAAALAAGNPSGAHQDALF